LTGDKLKTAHRIVAYLIVLLGIAHLGFTFIAYSRFSFGALWFIGSGLAIIFAGFLNIVLIGNEAAAADTAAWFLCLIANATSALLFALALTLFTEPQVFVGLGLFAFATVGTLLLRRTTTIGH